MAAPAPQAAMVSMADLNAALKAMLVPMLKDAQEPLLARMDDIDSHLKKIDSRLDEIATSVVKLEAAHSNENVRRYNSVRPVGASLAPLLFTYEGKAWPQDVQQPARMLDLAVSGAEQLPGGGKPNWNRGMSRRFLAHAVAPLQDDTDGEDEGSSQSRTSRLRVVQLMGGSFERVTGAVFALH
jgi:hypothetical protein